MKDMSSSRYQEKAGEFVFSNVTKTKLFRTGISEQDISGISWKELQYCNLRVSLLWDSKVLSIF
jgi:hypothetical protein